MQGSPGIATRVRTEGTRVRMGGGCSWGAGLGMPRRRGRGEDVAGRGCPHFCRWGKVPQRFFGEVGDRVGAPPIIPPTPLAPGPEP